MALLLSIHSYLRWLILVVALIAVIKFAIGWLRGGAFQKMDRGLASGFSGLMDLQALTGLILLVWGGFAGTGFPDVPHRARGHHDRRRGGCAPACAVEERGR